MVCARVDAVLFRRIINNLLNICIHALPKGNQSIVVSIDEDAQGKVKILLKPEQGSLSTKMLQEMFVEDRKLGDKVGFSISFQEFQAIVAKWDGKLEIISHDNDAIIQIIVPSKKL